MAAADTPAEAQVEIPATDYQALPKVSSRVEPMVRVAPTCMMWGIVIGLGLLALVLVMWTLPNVLDIIGKITGG